MTRPITYYVPLTGTDLDTIKNALKIAEDRIATDMTLMDEEEAQAELKKIRDLIARLG